MARNRQYAYRVNVVKMVKVEGKWPFARVVERNGRIIRDRVWVGDREEHHPEGRYYLEWYEEGRRRRKPVESFDHVLPAARAKSIELNAIKAGLMALPQPATPPTEPARLTMDAAIDQAVLSRNPSGNKVLSPVSGDLSARSPARISPWMRMLR